MSLVEEIKKGNKIIAVVIRAKFSKDPLEFLTPPDFPLQVGRHNRKKGTIMEPHFHHPFKNVKNLIVQEMFYVNEGRIKVNLFQRKEKINEIVLNKGEMIVMSCGHSIEFLEDSKLFEVKQGPYRGKENEKEYI